MRVFCLPVLYKSCPSVTVCLATKLQVKCWKEHVRRTVGAWYIQCAPHSLDNPLCSQVYLGFLYISLRISLPVPVPVPPDFEKVHKRILIHMVQCGSFRLFELLSAKPTCNPEGRGRESGACVFSRDKPHMAPSC